MLRYSFLLVTLAVAGLVAAGCSRPATTARADETKPAASEKNAVEGREFHVRLLEVAARYQKFGRFDERLRFGPPLCAAPSVPPKVEPSRLRLSASDDADTHGKKLYYLYAKDGTPYGYGSKKQPVGQVIVKEAWKPEPTKDKRTATVAFDPDDKQFYRAGEKLGLFIMLKLDPKTPNTDEGWVYGTVSADGKRVTSAGRVESCMACHRGEGTTDRMFGVRESEPGDAKR